MHPASPLVPLWLSHDDRLEIVRSIANHLEKNSSLTEEEKRLLLSAQSELSVAAAREGGTKISFAKLRKVIGQDDDSVPVKLSVDEKKMLVNALDLPIEVKHKLAS